MTPQRTDPFYQPIQFSEAEIAERYERKRQQEEYVIKENRERIDFRKRCLQAMKHESNIAELPIEITNVWPAK